MELSGIRRWRLEPARTKNNLIYCYARIHCVKCRINKRLPIGPTLLTLECSTGGTTEVVHNLDKWQNLPLHCSFLQRHIRNPIPAAHDRLNLLKPVSQSGLTGFGSPDRSLGELHPDFEQNERLEHLVVDVVLYLANLENQQLSSVGGSRSNSCRPNCQGT